MKSQFKTSVAWKRLRLEHLVQEVRRPVVLNPDREYREIGVRSHGRGVFKKEKVYGRDLGNKSVFYVNPGALVLNIVFAWEGAVAIAPEDTTGFICSHRFPSFQARSGVCDARFLQYFFQSEAGRQLLGLHSPGSAGRNRTLNQKELMKEWVVVPEWRHQSKVADFLDRKTVAIDAAIAKKQRLLALLEEKRAAVINQFLLRGMSLLVVQT